MHRGFTLIETLIVVAIIGVLASVVLPALRLAKDKAYHVRGTTEFRTMATALEFYKNDHNGNYPADVSRDIPPGLGPYLAGGNSQSWPKAPWPGSVYDWENWDDPDNPGKKIYQISIRFCPVGGTLSDCRFPAAAWAQNFGINSAVYYCIEGNCRSHSGEPANYPGYCVNCNN